jgi:hypothetical protein
MQQEEKSEASTQEARDRLHPAPSVLWFVITLGLLLLYAVLSR